jgi:alginate O-acetyltransferase complex protein AlgJ
LFLAEELEHAALGEFWNRDWAEVSLARTDPLPAMLDFQRRLRALGVRLLVVPVPTKVSVYPHRLDAGVEVVSQSAYLRRLEAAGLEVVDLEPVFLERRATVPGEPVFLAGDTHWAPAACLLAAREIIRRPGFPAGDRGRFIPDPVAEIEVHGDLARMLGEEAAPELVSVSKVRRRGAAGPGVGLSHPDSPVILLGDSNVTVFSEGTDEMFGAGAGLPDRLAQLSGVEADVLASHGDGVHQVRVELYRERSINPAVPGYWESKKLVIWCFAARAFTRAGRWSSRIPVAPPEPERE